MSLRSDVIFSSCSITPDLADDSMTLDKACSPTFLASTRAPSNACETCGESFDTRNKLFAHLGDTGHASLKSR